MSDGAPSRDRALAMALPFVLYPLYLAATGHARWETWAVLVLVPALALKGEATRKLMLGLYPVGLVGIFYDATRFIQNVGITTERVHLCDLRAIEKGLFGFRLGGEIFTIHDWTLIHHTRFLDVLASIPYGTFIFAAFGFAAYLYRTDFGALKRFGWTFFLLNIAAFVTYHVYPAAPPWYFHTHGCIVDVTAHASEGPALARVDALLGYHYFENFYARSHNVFGAVPSMHVSYPSLILIEGWALFGRPMRTCALLYWALMCFGAVYLDHHWILDLVVGLVYTVLARLLVGFVMARMKDRQAAGARQIA